MNRLKPFTGVRKSWLLSFGTGLAVLLILVRCANPVTPEGGPKDTTPPLVTATEPPDFSTHFATKTIRITFDEFVDLDNSPGKILISPPLLKDPDFKLRGKTLICSLEDTLRANSTYSMEIGKSITDITEKNPLGSYLYVFSTGSYLDSLTIAGTVLDAFTAQPMANIFVMVYLDDNDSIPFDSLPMKVKPRAVTVTNDQGIYQLRFLHDGEYRLMALQDLDGNMLYSMKGEKVGFCDTLIHPWYVPVEPPDTSRKDTLAKDTVSVTKAPGGKSILLRAFEETDSTQILTRYDVVRENQLRLIFRYPVRDLGLKRLNADSLADWCLREINPTHDTITLWTLPGISDTLNLAVSDLGMKTDTLAIDLKPKTLGKKPKRITGPVHKPLDGSLSNMGGMLNYFKAPLNLTMGYPLSRYQLNRAILVHEKDTVGLTMKPVDSLHRVFTIPYKWDEGKTYRLLIPDSVFFSFNGLSNDSLRFLVRTPYLREFGSLTMDIKAAETPGAYLVQLLGEKDKVLEQHSLTASGKISFQYLLPGKFRVKVIDDRNNNGKWDAGNFIRRLQPEMVYYFPQTIEVRANWDVEEPWALQP